MSSTRNMCDVESTPSAGEEQELEQRVIVMPKNEKMVTVSADFLRMMEAMTTQDRIHVARQSYKILAAQTLADHHQSHISELYRRLKRFREEGKEKEEELQGIIDRQNDTLVALLYKIEELEGAPDQVY